VATGQSVQTLTGHTASVTSVAFSPDASRIITGSQDQAAKLWDAQTGKEILTLSRHSEDVTSVTFSPDGRQILTGSRDGTAVIWLSHDWKEGPQVSAK
jgi:WD40 repeat protein